MLYDIDQDDELAYTQPQWDKEKIIHVDNPKHYLKQNRNANLQKYPIINLIMEEGIRKILDIEVGEPSLKLCSYDHLDCYQARVVMMCKRFPSYFMSSHYSMSQLLIIPIVSKR